MIDFALGNEVVIDTEYMAAIQEIDIIFNTEQTEVLGDVMFGSNFGQFMWDMAIGENEIENYIASLLNQECEYLSYIPFDVTVETLKDEDGDGLFVVTITLYNSTGKAVATVKNTIK